jgi:hypothetical protein
MQSTSIPPSLSPGSSSGADSEPRPGGPLHATANLSDQRGYDGSCPRFRGGGLLTFLSASYPLGSRQVLFFRHSSRFGCRSLRPWGWARALPAHGISRAAHGGPSPACCRGSRDRGNRTACSSAVDPWECCATGSPQPSPHFAPAISMR